MWAVLTRTAFLHASGVVCLPSSLFPVAVAILPSTTAAAVLLLARLSSSECVAADIVLGTVGLVLVALPVAWFVLIWSVHVGWSTRGNEWVTTRRAFENVDKTEMSAPQAAVLYRSTVNRRWDWTTTDGHRGGMEHAWAVSCKLCAEALCRHCASRRPRTTPVSMSCTRCWNQK
ncbi:membrane-associated protein, putative [Bodo saltans]|uniref:Membrane-associated protein, putative n=1 Tax=Bodo saltans TaxID=75058 RepID=A0A0S4J5G4_BODSA|nr:membrane-associated protein, putative [Bodo saltans]|eukprot:CUG77196.1 membrane-associated protein, putative [Bodo saltans]